MAKVKLLNARNDYGGMLVIDGASKKHIVSPGFNRLVLFDVSGAGRDHHVTEVTAGTLLKRLSISGWYG